MNRSERTQLVYCAITAIVGIGIAAVIPPIVALATFPNADLGDVRGLKSVVESMGAAAQVTPACLTFGLILAAGASVYAFALLAKCFVRGGRESPTSP
jgi:hypothetical protein